MEYTYCSGFKENTAGVYVAGKQNSNRRSNLIVLPKGVIIPQQPHRKQTWLGCVCGCCVIACMLLVTILHLKPGGQLIIDFVAWNAVKPSTSVQRHNEALEPIIYQSTDAEHIKQGRALTEGTHRQESPIECLRTAPGVT